MNDCMSYVSDSSGLNKFLAKVYGWMFAGLLVTAAVAFGILMLLYSAYAGSMGAYNILNALLSGVGILCIAEVILVIVLSAKLNSMKASTAKIMFMVYALLNGVNIGVICLNVGIGTVYRAFLLTAVAFGVMSLYGMKTNTDLTSFGNLMKMGLIGLLVMSLINIFLGSDTIDWIVCIVGLAVFLGLTAYDTKKIKGFYYSMSGYSEDYLVEGEENTVQGEMVSKVAIIGALELYLDVINIFLYLIRIFSKNRD